jgi:DNA-binding CsgD family transcriptional regulator
MNTAESPLPENPALTSREVQCLEGLARGLSNNEIAKHLQISGPTVALHLSNARKKLSAKTREQAIALAVARHLITLRNPEQ